MSSSPPVSAHPKFRRSAKNYLLDRPFQLKYTGSLVGLTLAIGLALGFLVYRQATVTVSTGYEAVRVGSEANAAGQDAVAQSKSLTTIIEINAEKNYGDNPTLLAAVRADNKIESDKIEARALQLGTTQRKLEQQHHALEQQRTILITTLAAVLTLLVLFVGLAGIVFTHKVAGPIHKMKRLLREVGDGRLIVPGKLRKGDELQEFFEVFATMVVRLRERQSEEIALLNQAIVAAAMTGVEDDALVDLRRLHKRMEQALE